MMSGVSYSTLDNLVNYKTFNPKIKTLHKIASAFSLTLSEFFDYPELESFSFDDDHDIETGTSWWETGTKSMVPVFDEK